MRHKHLRDFVGNTPLVVLKRIWQSDKVTVLAKLEGNNPAGSVKDRPALNMIARAEERGVIQPGDTLIEATSGNTGIALAMAAAMMDYRMVLIMPDHMSEERRAAMRAYGAVIISVPQSGGMEQARDMAEEMQKQGKGKVLDQFANPDNWDAHYRSTAPEIWRDTGGTVTHIVSSMGTTGTIMGISRYMKEKDDRIRIIGVQPDGDSSIPGIRRWPIEYLPKIFEAHRVDETIDISQSAAEKMMRRLAVEEGIFGGVSSGGATAVALQVAADLEKKNHPAVIVTIVCDRGDRYLSTGVY